LAPAREKYALLSGAGDRRAKITAAKERGAKADARLQNGLLSGGLDIAVFAKLISKAYFMDGRRMDRCFFRVV
jgi:hypothetical protein